MKPIDLTIPLGVATPAWPTYEPLEVKYFKRLAPNGANGQLVTHSNHVGTHLDGEIHFFTPGKDIAALDLDFLMHEGVIVDLSDAVKDYEVYTSAMVEERVEVRDGDILIVHTGFHHFGWDQPVADEVRYMVKHPGPDREFAEWAKRRKLRWIGVDCGSADHPMNTKIREWMPRQAAECDRHMTKRYGRGLGAVFPDDKYQLMHIEMFDHGIIHAECLGGDIDLLLNRRALIGCFPWRFVDGESSIARIVAFVEDGEHAALMRRKGRCRLTRFGDIAGALNPALHRDGRERARAHARRQARKRVGR
ncbi:MAG: cyclase family protein [Acidobacteria bacterium]|nr:cyclase family protein [Acidobacteriota bacterium]